VHSLVQFEDGSMKAQMGLPDMKLPIQYALTFPYRLKTDFPRFNFTDYSVLNFETPDLKTFKNLALAFEALAKDGNIPCALNAANEIAVQAFLDERIGFLDIARINEHVMNGVAHISTPSLDDYIATDMEARRIANELILS